MKINVNYELEKIRDARNVFNVRRVCRRAIIVTGVGESIAFMLRPTELEQLAIRFLTVALEELLIISGLELIHSSQNKSEAARTLRILSSQLSALDVSTDSNLLLDSEVYKTEYKINFSDGIVPKIMQNKYILVPTHDDEQVSLLQEHVIGTKSFDLSVGEPDKQKQYKLAYNGA